MIYFCVGNNTKKKQAFIFGLAKNRERISLGAQSVEKETLLNYASNASLFGEYPVIILENVFTESKIEFSSNDLTILKNSKTIFVFLEDKFLTADEKKYKKYAEQIEKFEEKIIKAIPKDTPFAIADAFGRKDKIGAWALYIQAVDHGMEPEGIAGMLFWKIKNMILSDSKVFKKEQLKSFSSEIVSLYHKAHNGECDFYIGLEQFILTSLS